MVNYAMPITAQPWTIERLRSLCTEDANGCWIYQRRCSPYAQVDACIPRERSGHRLAWRLTHGDIPEGAGVLHDCDVKACCNPAHLHLGTNADNMREASSRHLVGSLSAEDVRLIRSSSETDRVMAQRLNVSKMVVFNARTGYTYADSVAEVAPVRRRLVRPVEGLHAASGEERRWPHPRACWEDLGIDASNLGAVLNGRMISRLKGWTLKWA